MTGKINGKQHMLKRLSDECDIQQVFDDFFGTTSQMKTNSSNHESCSSPKTFQSITRSRSHDVHLFLHEDHNSKEEEENDSDILISAKTPFLPDAASTTPTKDTQNDMSSDSHKKTDKFGTAVTVLVATTKLKSCLRNPLRKKHKNSDPDTDNGKEMRKMLKKQSKRHIGWAEENLIQNENDGRGINSKILNMAIVASGPALLQGMSAATSRRTSDVDTPLPTNSSICFDITSQGRKPSFSTPVTSDTTSINVSRRRSSVMVTSLVKSLDKLGKYRPFKSSSGRAKPNMLHNIMASATTYEPTLFTKETVLTTTTISDAASTSDNTFLTNNSVPYQGSTSNPLAYTSNISNSGVHGGGSGGGLDNIENANEIMYDSYESPSLSLKSCPASVPRRRKRSIHTHNIDSNNQRRRPSVHDDVIRARGKGILSPRFMPKTRRNGCNQTRQPPDRKINVEKIKNGLKRTPKRGRNRRSSIRNANNNNMKNICT
jgi:hypothetical protein